MSENARTVLVITDDPSFSAMVSEQLLRTGVQMIRFASMPEALERALQWMPDLILMHILPGDLEQGWKYYHMIQSDTALSAIPILFYAAPRALAERAVGDGTDRQMSDRLAVSDMLIGQISPLLRVASPRWPRAAAEASLHK